MDMSGFENLIRVVTGDQDRLTQQDNRVDLELVGWTGKSRSPF